ncbi:MAG TPA: M48 family metallopeptidase [Planctomycetota bacterium]|nr:M48 family metallopeptidase [Planctomycetota bacterium]
MRQNPSLAGRAVLAIVLMVGFYALALGICATLALAVFHDLEGRRVHAKVILFAVITIGVLLWSVFPRAVKFPDPGVKLREADQPRLWQLVRNVAQAAGQEPPRELFLVDDINAFVAERGSRMGFGGSRVMGIGLPLLQVLSVTQLKSVLAHEFGHFHGGDTRLGPFIYRTRDAIGRTIVNLRKAESIVSKPFEWYGNLFLRVTYGISRAQEFAADALSVQLVGLEPVQTALRRVNETAPLYEQYVDSEFLPVLNRKVRPPLMEGFALFLSSRTIRAMSVKVGEEAMQAKGNPYDSHPPLSQRLAAAAEVEKPGAERAAGPPALSLLQGVDALEAQLLVFQTGAAEIGKLPVATWKDVAVPTVLDHWRRFANDHGRKLPLVRAADLVARRPELARFAAAFNPKIPLNEQLAAGGWAMGVLLGHALVQAGWTLETGPGDPAVVVRGDARLEPGAIGRELSEGKLSATEWSDTCAKAAIGDVIIAGPDLPIAS